MSVRAIVIGHTPAAVEDAEEVVQLDGSAGASRSALLRAALADGAASGHRWLWVLEDVVPRPGALATLLDWAAEHPTVDLLAARVEDADGAPRFYREWPDYGDIDAVIAGADMRALPLRAASFHGLLLSTAAVRAHGLPRAGDAAWRAEWEYTGHLLRAIEGWLVPASVVRLVPDALVVDRVSDLRNGLWVARSGAWGARERFDRHFQWAVAAARQPGRRDALRALKASLRRAPS